MPAISYDDVKAYVTPAPSWRFYVTFPQIPTAPNVTLPMSIVSGQQLSFLVARVSAVQKTVETEAIVFQAGTRHFPTGYAVENLAIMFAEDINYTVAQAFRAWIDAVVDNSGNFGLPVNYKKKIILEPLGYLGRPLVAITWQSCFPTGLDGIDFDGSATNHVAPTVTFTVDGIDTILVESTDTSLSAPAPVLS